eukprot:Seg1738.8 transcript_id=Seg1738.8/GoldUCD/mRNA.D3Y31 product="putative RNA polymerase II subunit B1 CTD phosphatase RPAP2" protein_id=Seg1738.8/GoldUCD/D3Y31
MTLRFSNFNEVRCCENAFKNKEKELRQNIEAQVAHEKRAYKNVEKTVLSDAVGRDILQDVVNEIMPSHYADIVEERSIAKLCGYPLCSNKLAKVSRQNFHISVQRRKVYDITERKYFCSSKCYKASKYVESQIPASPLWLRAERSVDDKIQHSGPAENNLLQDHGEPSAESEAHHVSESRISTRAPSSKAESPKITSQTTSSSTTTKGRTKLIELPAMSIETKKDIDADKLCNLLEEWCTVDTYRLLQQKRNGAKVAEQLGKPNNADEEESASPEIAKRNAAKKFLKDNYEWNSEIVSADDVNKRPLVSKAFVSPLVDSRSQDSIRRRIVSQKLNHSLSEVFSDLSMSIVDFKLDLASLIKTFRFTSQNISLKHKEWKLIATALLHALSSEDKELTAIMERRSKEMQAIFDNYGVEKDKFTKLLEILKKFDKTSFHETPSEHDCEYDNDSLD